MCIGRNRELYYSKIAKNRNAAPTVTGTQIGVDNPIDTKKVTEQLKIKRLDELEKINKPLTGRGRSPFDLRV